MSQRLCIIVTVWNQIDKTVNCLETLYRQDYPDLSVVVVNNGSTDDTVAQIEARFPQVHLINLPENLGPTGGYNVGFRYALANEFELIFLLNNDTLLAENCVSELAKELNRHDDVVMVMPKIYYADEPNRIWNAGGIRNSLNLEANYIGVDQIDDGNYGEARDIDDAPFCAVLFKRAIFDSLGLPSEDYFLYYEDSDYCLRVRRHGYRIRFAPAATMWHVVSASSGGSNSPSERYWMARSSVLFFRKNVNWWRWLFVIPWRTGSAILWTLRLLKQRKIESLRSYWRGLRDGLRQSLAPNSA